MFSSKRSFRRLAAVACVFAAVSFAATSAAAFNLVPGDLVIADAGAAGGTDGQILVVPGTGGPAQVIIGTASGLSDPVSVAIEPNGQLIVLDTGNLEIYRVDPDAETFVTVVTGLTGGTAIALDAVGRILLLDPSIPALLAFLPNGTPQPTISSGQFFGTGVVGMAVEASGTIAVTTTNGASAGLVIRVDPTQPAGSNQTPLSNVAPIADPTDIAVDAAGNFIFGDSGVPGLLGLAQTGGTAFAVSTGALGYVTPSGLAVEATGNVVVVDSGTGVVSRVDPTPPPPAINNQSGLSSGAPLSAPSGVDVATVPEPTAFLAQGTALMVLGLIAARRRRG